MLSSDEVSAILRRAAEIEDERESAAGLAPDRIDLDAVEQAAGEVGISVESVRQAYAELQVGGLPVEPDGMSSRPEILGPAKVAEQRVVRLPVDEARARIGRALNKQTFELRRSDANASLWRRRNDFGAELRRGFDFNKKIKLADARTIIVQLTEVVDRDGRAATLVRMEADIGQIKAGTATASVAVPTTAAALAGGIGALVGEPAVALMAAGAWIPLTAGSVGLGRFLYRKEYLKVSELLGMFLDRLEG